MNKIRVYVLIDPHGKPNANFTAHFAYMVRHEAVLGFSHEGVKEWKDLYKYGWRVKPATLILK